MNSFCIVSRYFMLGYRNLNVKWDDIAEVIFLGWTGPPYAYMLSVSTGDTKSFSTYQFLVLTSGPSSPGYPLRPVGPRRYQNLSVIYDKDRKNQICMSISMSRVSRLIIWPQLSLLNGCRTLV